MHTILVTGATGTVGEATVKALVEKGHHVRAGVHSIIKGERLKHPQIELVELDFGRPEAIEAALTGIERLFLITPFSENQVEMSRKLVAQAKKCGVEHIVRLSAIGSGGELNIQKTRWHREVEHLIEESGVAFTHLRPNSFMQNFANFYGESIRTESKFYLPLGQGRISYVDARDIADTAVSVLTGKQHMNQAYTLTGPEALSGDDIAHHLSKALGRVISYMDVPEDIARQTMSSQHQPQWKIDAMLELHAIGKAGQAAMVDPAVEKLTGTRARSFAEFLNDYKHLFEQKETAASE